MRRRTRLLSIVVVAGLIGSAAQSAFAQPSDSRSREAAAMEFARSHHPELAKLLDRLESTDRKAYEKAVKDVFQASERLGKLAESDPERYALSLRTWTLDSRIRLLAARSTMSDDPGIESELRDLLRERRNARVAMLRFDRDRLAAKLEKIDGQLEQLDRDPEAAIEHDLVRINRDIKASADRRRRAADQADGPKRDEKRSAKRKASETDDRKDRPSTSDAPKQSGDAKPSRTEKPARKSPAKTSNER